MRRRTAVAAVAVALAAGALATAPSASADAGPWPGTDGKVLIDGPALIDPATGAATQVPNSLSGTYPAWAPDGSRLISSQGQHLQSIRPSGASPFSTPAGKGFRSGAAYDDLAFWWGGEYVLFSAGGQLGYGPSDASWAPEPLLTATQEPSTVCDNDPAASPTGLIAFARRINSDCSGNDGVWIYDPDADTVERIIPDAAQPAFSPDGTKLAFVRDPAEGGLSQIFTANADGTDVTQVTTGPRGYANPSWSADGNRIIFDAHTSGDSSDVHTTEYLDLTTGTYTKVASQQSNQGSNPSWQPLRKNATSRVWGADTYATNIASSRWTWNTVGRSEPGLLDAKAAVLINRDSPSYSLTAAALAGKKQGPVLMTPGSGLSSAVKTELKRTLKPGASVYLIGGTSMLSSTVSSQVSSLGFVPKRLAGTSRYSTSVAVAKAITSGPEYVFVATGTDYHSALAASAAAGADGTSSAGGVVLNDGNTLTSSVKNYLNSLNPDNTMIIPVGSTAKYALTHTSFSHWPSTYYYYPITAGSHEATAVALAKFWWSSPIQVGLADVDSWHGGASAAAAMNVWGPVLWTSPGTLSTDTKNYLLRESAATRSVTAFGGSGSVAPSTLDASGAAESASSSQFVYYPYYNGVASAAARQNTFLARTNGGNPTTAARTGPTTTKPNLRPFRTPHRQ